MLPSFLPRQCSTEQLDKNHALHLCYSILMGPGEKEKVRGFSLECSLEQGLIEFYPDILNCSCQENLFLLTTQSLCLPSEKPEDNTTLTTPTKC